MLPYNSGTFCGYQLSGILFSNKGIPRIQLLKVPFLSFLAIGDWAQKTNCSVSFFYLFIDVKMMRVSQKESKEKT